MLLCLLTLHLNLAAVATLRAMTTPVKIGVVAVGAPLDLRSSCPLTSPFSTHVLHIGIPLGAEGAYVGLLWVLFLDIDELDAGRTCNFDVIAIASLVAMTSIEHLLVALVRAILHTLPTFPRPPSCAPPTRVRIVNGALGAIGTWRFVLWILVHNTLEDLFGTSCPAIPETAVRKIPAASARFVAAIEMASLCLVPLTIRTLISATVLVDDQSPRGTRIAVISGTSAWFSANHSSIPRLPCDQPAQ